ncbi:MAG: hypothetical protein J6T10_30090 [Methanobrevibacter sp.]|nr:hypothetical protein [Methanobrevibacter sp.]
MMYPIVMPVHTGGGSIRPFGSTLEMIACGSLFLFLTTIIIGVAIFVSIEADSLLAKIFAWLCATFLIIGLWCIFALCC